MSSGDPSRCRSCGAQLSEHATICPNCYSYVTPSEEVTRYEKAPFEDEYHEEEPYEEEYYEPEPREEPRRPRRPVEPPERRRPPPRRAMPERPPRPRGIPVSPRPTPWKRILVGAVLGIILLIIIVTGLISTDWYSTEYVIFQTNVDYSFGLYEVNARPVGGAEASLTYSELEEGAGYELGVIDIAKTTRGLLYLGLVFTILFLILAFLAAAGRMSALNGWVPVMVGFIAALIVLVAIAYFAIEFPAEIEQNLGEDYTQGGGLEGSWYLLLFSAILGFVGANLAKGAPRYVMPPGYRPDY